LRCRGSGEGRSEGKRQDSAAALQSRRLSRDSYSN
jgi:hypothetical protein